LLTIVAGLPTAPDWSALLALLAPFQRDAALHITAQLSI